MTDEMLTPCTPHCFSKLSQTKLEQHNEPTASVKVRCFQLFWTLEIVSFFFPSSCETPSSNFFVLFFLFCFFFKFPSVIPRNSQEPTFRATIAIWGIASSVSLLFHVHPMSFGKNTCMISKLRNMFPRIRKVFRGNRGKMYKVSGLFCKLLEEPVATYHECLGSCF